MENEKEIREQTYKNIYRALSERNALYNGLETSLKFDLTMEYMIDQWRELDRFRDLPEKLEKARLLLKELLPMQGCVQCQEVYMACDLHGDIRETTKRAEEFLST